MPGGALGGHTRFDGVLLPFRGLLRADKAAI